MRAGAQGTMSLAVLALCLQALIGAVVLGDFYHECDLSAQWGMMAARALDDFEKQVGPADDHRPRVAGGPPTNTGPQTNTGSAANTGLAANTGRGTAIRFEALSFTYPGGERAVLDGLDLTLRAGECTALVGLNGAGKTTLVKLLARLYEPTAGRLLADGADIRTQNADAWRRRVAVVFQDFNRYEFSLRDNITLGAVERVASDDEVRATAERAGLGELLSTLPGGLDTVLARTYDGGTDLSGGQWQRIAIARALFAVEAGARVLVLDEPTAALDVRAEAAFFDRFVELTRGTTSLLISHRLSSVRRADRIVVLEHGRLIEDGTHESLLHEGGRYAALFAVQAARFAEGLDVDDDIETQATDEATTHEESGVAEVSA
jgi:ATP-binding cassette subfamily B protein